MKTSKININQLKPADYNPRIMPPTEMEKLKKGLKTHGLIDPIIIDLTDNNTVIGGHQRLEALKELNGDDQELTLIPLGDIGLVIKETDLKVHDKNDQKAKNLSLNKIQGDWDYKLLDDILVDLQEQHYDIELTGFDLDDISLNQEDFDFNFFEDTTDEEELPPDLNNDLEGETPNQAFVVHFSFKTKETADKFLTDLNITKRNNQGNQLSIFEDIDFFVKDD